MQWDTILQQLYGFPFNIAAGIVPGIAIGLWQRWQGSPGRVISDLRNADLERAINRSFLYALLRLVRVTLEQAQVPLHPRDQAYLREREAEGMRQVAALLKGPPPRPVLQQPAELQRILSTRSRDGWTDHVQGRLVEAALQWAPKAPEYYHSLVRERILALFTHFFEKEIKKGGKVAEILAARMAAGIEDEVIYAQEMLDSLGGALDELKLFMVEWRAEVREQFERLGHKVDRLTSQVEGYMRQSGAARPERYHERLEPEPEHFMNRLDDLQNLHGRIEALDPARRILTLIGPGGIGKTTLLYAYARRFQQGVRYSFCLEAETPDQVLEGLRGIAVSLGLAVSEPDEVRARAAVDWLKHNADWLLLIDNLESVARHRLGWLKEVMAQGLLLVTARRRPNWLHGEIFRVGQVSEPAASAYLESVVVLATPDPAGLAKVVQRVGPYPLALKAAARALQVMERRIARRSATTTLAEDPSRSPCGRYLESLPNWDGGQDAGYPRSVREAIGHNIRQATESAPPDRVGLVLMRAGLVASSGIPAELLADEHDDDIVDHIIEWSLLEHPGPDEGYRMHRVIQEIVRLEGQERLEAEVGALLGRLEGLAPFDEMDVAQRVNYRRYLPHIEAVQEHARSFLAKLALRSRLHERTSKYLAAVGLYSEAIKTATTVAAWAESAWGRYDARTLLLLRNLAQRMTEGERVAEALQLLLEIRPHLKARFGEGHVEVATAKHILANCYMARQRFAEARLLYQEALAMRRAHFGRRHVAVAGTINNLGHCLSEMGDWPRAVQFLKRALAIYAKLYGKQHLAVATPYHNLSILYMESGKYETALMLNQRALDIYQQHLDPDHPDMALALNSRGNLFIHLNQELEALDYFARALAIYRKRFEAEHPLIAWTLSLIGFPYLNNGRYAEARSFFEQALAMYAALGITQDPSIAASLWGLAEASWCEKEFSTALSLYGRAFALELEMGGPLSVDLDRRTREMVQLIQERSVPPTQVPEVVGVLAHLQSSLPEAHPVSRLLGELIDAVYSSLLKTAAAAHDPDPTTKASQ